MAFTSTRGGGRWTAGGGCTSPRSGGSGFAVGGGRAKRAAERSSGCAAAGCDAVTAGKRQGVTRQQFRRSHTCRGGGTRRETASKIVGLRRALDIRLRPWAFRPGIGLLPMGFCCATSPVVASAIRTREWPLSRVFVDFNRQYVRSGHYGDGRAPAVHARPICSLRGSSMGTLRTSGRMRCGARQMKKPPHRRCTTDRDFLRRRAPQRFNAFVIAGVRKPAQ
jgi:hypothetical protein